MTKDAGYDSVTRPSSTRFPGGSAQTGDWPEARQYVALSREAARRTLLGLLRQAGVANGRKSDLERLLCDHDGPYSALLGLLTHLKFDETTSRRHWQVICAHHRALAERIGRDPGMPVVVLDYFQNVRHVLDAPTIVEREIFDATERSAMVDALTELFNRRYFQESLDREVERAQRYGDQFSLVLFDIDDFKQINDRHGHAVGDDALVHVSSIIRRNLRQVDVPCRFGGEEFALILPGTGRAGAVALADRIRADIARLFRKHRFRGRTLKLTLSGGVATCPDDAWSADRLIRCSDEALYHAKRSGKNRIAPDDAGKAPALTEHSNAPLTQSSLRDKFPV